MKIVNTSDKPYEWTFDGYIWGPLGPGDVGDYPLEVAMHAIRRSVINDDEGQPVGYRCELLDSLKTDRGRFNDIVAYPCPFKSIGDCDAAPFKTKGELKVHLELHWDASAKNPREDSDRVDLIGSIPAPQRRTR